MRRVLLPAAILSLLLTGSSGTAASGSLPTVLQGPRPGPDVLYAPLATAPQLSNGSGWSAAPLMVSGAQAYVGGEYLYQDYVYDSFGANTTNIPLLQPEPIPAASDTLFGGATGDLVYPTDAATYAYDAADLLEFRARLDDAGNIVYRVTLNTLIVGKAVAVAIGVDSEAGGSDDWGSGIGTLGDLNLDHVVVASDNWGTLDGAAVATTTDVATNQIEVTTTLKPAGSTWRHYLVAGVFDYPEKTFTQVLEQPSATAPGGAHGTTPPPVFNVGFRFNEPIIRGNIEGTVADPLGSTGSRSVGAGHYREHAQALALAARNIAGFGADIDFAALAAGTTDMSGVPKTGFISRLYASHLNLGEGAQPDRPMLRGKIQPYGLYVPTTYDSSTPAPFTLALHSLSCSYNQYAGFAPNLYRDLGEERGALVLTPEGRGPDGWYHDEAEVDVFEAWADAAARYSLDPDRVAVTGYSMGGYGTWKLASQYPDLFTSGFAVVGPGGENILHAPTNGLVPDAQGTLAILDNLRHVPVLAWYGANDELVPVAGATMMLNRMLRLGYEHEVDIFPGYDHFLFSLLDEWGPGQAWINRPPINRNPSRVTYRAKPSADNAALGLVHDHAYWLQDIRVAFGAATGLVDAQSMASGIEPRTTVALPPFGIDPAPHVKSGRTADGFAVSTPSNKLVVALEGVASATLWPERAGIQSGELTLELTSTHAATLTLAGSFGTRVVAVPTGFREVTVTL